MRLGNFFPPELKNEAADNHLAVGAVLRFFTTDTTPPKTKIAVIVGFDHHKVLLACIFVNTEINPHVFPTEELRNLHYPLAALGRDYLNHDSYADCSQLFEYSVEDIKQKMVEDVEIHRGDLSDEDRTAILEKIRQAVTIATKLKRNFGLIPPANPTP